MKVFFALFAGFVAALWALAIIITPGPSDPNVTVIYWSTDPNPARNDQLAPFRELHPEIEVLIDPTTFEKVLVQCSVGIGPDIIEIYSVADMVAFAEAGILKDLTPYAKEYGFGLETTYPKLRGMITYDGKQYAYPANLASQIIFYNRRMFREAGIEEPRDGMPWDEFIELMKPLTVRRATGRGYEQFAMVMARHYASDIHLQFGARFFNETGTRCIVDSDDSVRAVQFYYDLMKAHEVIPTPDAADALSSEGGWGSGEIRWFATRRAAAIWGSRWMLVQFRQYPDVREEIGCVLLPTARGGVPASYAVGRTPAINVRTRHPEESLKFLGYLASDEYSETIALGGDAMPPSRDFADDPTRLLNPQYPWENYQEKFVKSLEHAEPIQISPFVDPKFVERVWIETLEVVENDIQPVEAAMRSMANRINDRIQHNVRQRQDLRRLYEELKAKSVSMAGP